jgi:ParB family chromosome partitioning protein
MKADEKRKIFSDAVDLIGGSDVTAVAGNGIEMLPIDKIKPYHDHPFHLYEGERLQDMAESIREHGVLCPVIVQRKGREYEMLSGHNRRNAARLAGLKEIPAIVKTDLSPEEAYLYVIETNVLQRSFSELKLSEQAAVMAEHYEKMCGNLRHDEIVKELEALTGKRDLLSGGHNGHRRKSRDIIAAEYGFSSRSAARLLRLNNLIPEFKKLVDDGSLALLAAVDLSFLTEKEQRLVWDIVDRQNLKVKPKMATELRSHSGDLTAENIADIIDAVTVRQHSVNAGVSLRLPHTVCERYFAGMNTEQMAAVVEKALAAWYEEKEAV